MKDSRLAVLLRIVALVAAVSCFAVVLFRNDIHSSDVYRPAVSATPPATSWVLPEPTRANRGYVRPPLPQKTTPTYAVPLVAKTTPAPVPTPAPVRATHIQRPTPRPIVTHSRGRWRSLGVQDVTEYCATGNRNAAGLWPRLGDVAVLDRSIPFGTRVRIAGRIYVVRDWVGQGTDFDIYNGSGGCESRALNFGRHHERVEIT